MHISFDRLQEIHRDISALVGLVPSSKREEAERLARELKSFLPLVDGRTTQEARDRRSRAFEFKRETEIFLVSDDVQNRSTEVVGWSNLSKEFNNLREGAIRSKFSVGGGKRWFLSNYDGFEGGLTVFRTGRFAEAPDTSNKSRLEQLVGRPILTTRFPRAKR